MELPDDRIIVDAVLAGDKQAYAGIVDRYKNKLYGLFRKMGMTEADAQDLTQETLFKAYRKLDTQRPEQSFSAWLHMIALNLFRDRGRRKIAVPHEPILETAAPKTDTPEESLLRTELREELNELLDTLPDDFTERFMAELEGIEMDSAKDTEAEPPPLADPEKASKRSVRKKRVKRKGFWIVSAVVLFLAGGILLSTQPTIAEHVRSLFSKDSITDKGMTEARDAGFLTSTDVFATDEESGYTVKIEELIADSTRLVVGLTVSDKHG